MTFFDVSAPWEVPYEYGEKNDRQCRTQNRVKKWPIQLLFENSEFSVGVSDVLKVFLINAEPASANLLSCRSEAWSNQT